jgi:hypothetical protein
MSLEADSTLTPAHREHQSAGPNLLYLSGRGAAAPRGRLATRDSSLHLLRYRALEETS